jgi:GWxTD domain-containing protein
VKKLASILAGLAMSACALAQLNQYKDWDKSADAYLLTPTERTEWKSVTSDADAEKFIATYWARREGGPLNRQEVQRRIAAADQQFKMPRYKRGADSVRGRLLVVLGPPSRAAQQAMGPTDAPAPQGEGGFQPGPAGSDTGGAEEGQAMSVWTYDKDKLAPFGLGALQARVVLDQRRGMDSLQNSGEIEKAIAAVAQKSIVNPNATASAAPAGAGAPPASAPGAAAGAAAGAPAAGAAPGAASAAKPPAGAPAAPGAPGSAAAPAAGAAASAAGAAAAAPPAAPVAALPAAAKTALASIDAKAPSDASFWSGLFRTGAGDPFLALQFYLPADKPSLAAPTLHFGGVVTDDSGKEVGTYWEEAMFAEVAEGTRKDRVVDKSIALPPGKYKGSFGLFTAEGQPPVAASTVSFQLPEKSTDFEVSPLLLSNGIIPLTKRPGPTDPFVFGSDKPMKVEPKGDRHFSKGDSLWYFYAVANPKLPEATGDAAAAKPRIMTRINVQLEGKDAFAPFTGPADLQEVAPGYFVTGSEIPLASFEPGYYSFLVKVRDLNAAAGTPANKGIDRQQDFVVLMPDGSMPPQKKATAPAPPPSKKKPG